MLEYLQVKSVISIKRSEDQLVELKRQREELKRKIRALVDELGPK